MFNDRRKTRRRRLERPAVVWAENGGQIATCTVTNVSARGAHMTIDEGIELPTTFTLLLSDNGQVYRACRVIWREGGEIGVAFPEDCAADRPSYIETGVRFVG